MFYVYLCTLTTGFWLIFLCQSMLSVAELGLNNNLQYDFVAFYVYTHQRAN